MKSLFSSPSFTHSFTRSPLPLGSLPLARSLLPVGVVPVNQTQSLHWGKEELGPGVQAGSLDCCGVLVVVLVLVLPHKEVEEREGEGQQVDLPVHRAEGQNDGSHPDEELGLLSPRAVHSVPSQLFVGLTPVKLDVEHEGGDHAQDRGEPPHPHGCADPPGIVEDCCLQEGGNEEELVQQDHLRCQVVRRKPGHVDFDADLGVEPEDERIPPAHNHRRVRVFVGI
mmetsp:Transcript_14366/g.28902  ORF Transcript_14366/g.28902 Transcript_14366/m.28902 type:complete len:225 (-) Transcript_14366:656-1330(-)